MAANFRNIKTPEYKGLYLLGIPIFIKDPGGSLNSIKGLTLGQNAILLATFPQSGTHWVYEMTEMLLKGKAEYCSNSRETVYLEGLTDLGPLHLYNRVVSTHVPFHWLPKQHIDGSGEIILVIHNPKDTAVSMFKLFDSARVNKYKSFKEFLDEEFFGPKTMYGGWYEYNKEFLKQAAIRKNQIIVISFEKLKKVLSLMFYAS